MKRKNNLLLIACCILAIQIPGVYAKDPTPEQLVAAHLNSIGEPDALSQINSMRITGTAAANLILGWQGHMSGPATIVSQGTQIGIAMMFQALDYPGEHFAYDGRNVTVATIQPGVRTPIAEFLRRYNRIMNNGMLGGVLSTAWPLLDVRGARPTMRGLRKTRVDGNELYELEYRPRNNHSDMRIRLYFDPETYRHVRTEYRTSHWEERGYIYTTLTEKFENFRQVGDLTLPHGYTLDYSSENPEFIANWKINAQKIEFNVSDIDMNFFRAE
jgi:hypothetical protein